MSTDQLIKKLVDAGYKVDIRMALTGPCYFVNDSYLPYAIDEMHMLLDSYWEMDDLE